MRGPWGETGGRRKSRRGAADLSAEEYDLLRKSVREFAQKNIDPVAVKIEQEGLSRHAIESLAAQGFMGARIPTDQGGSGLDERGYMIVLEELARCSPSVAARVLILNSLFAPLLSASGQRLELLPKVASGQTNATVAFSSLLEGHGHGSGVALTGPKASGRLDYVLSADADAVIAPSAPPGDSLLLLEGGFALAEAYPQLGFKGLKFAALLVESSDFRVLSQDGSKKLEAAFDGMDSAVAAVALGIAAGALAKAVEYSKSRTTFEHALKDYQPVAFGLSQLRSEEDILRGFLYGADMTSGSRAVAKVKGLALARNATKQALQAHGGYGYFADFGVEKFYRDAMALSVLFGRSARDQERLAEGYYGARAGFL